MNKRCVPLRYIIITTIRRCDIKEITRERNLFKHVPRSQAVSLVKNKEIKGKEARAQKKNEREREGGEKPP